MVVLAPVVISAQQLSARSHQMSRASRRAGKTGGDGDLARSWHASVRSLQRYAPPVPEQ